MLLNEELSIVDIEEELKSSYLDYAMSVIIGRALPDIRDGLKPVHRRVLYAMHELGLVWNKPFKKSARIVGEVLGKFHPHGDASVYDAICRMVQDFSLRYPLINGQGNFGSIDGDSPAAMRYTEIRLAKISSEFLTDIDKETVDFTKNFDESLDEPVVLPTVIPNLLINGSSGIAVGMATNIPPHNLGEVINALIYLVDKPDSTDEEIFQYIQGPDFPTAGIIYGKRGLREAYTTGKGIIKVRGKADIEIEPSTGKNSIIISQIPYQVNKTKLLENIAEMINSKKIEGISDLRDESDRDGMRIVLELKRNEVALPIINSLYKHTSLEVSFGINMVALINNQPKLLTLREILSTFIEFRKEIILRRTAFELKKAQERAHILEGLKKALQFIDKIIEIIKSSKTVEQAKGSLILEFSFSDLQAKAILEMRLQRLTGMERDSLEEELSNLNKKISYYKDLLSNDLMVFQLIKDELRAIQESYKDSRLTLVKEDEEEINLEDTMVEQEMVVTITHRGYIKRTSLDQYKIQKRKGMGVRGLVTVEEDFTTHLFVTTTHNFMFFFSDLGRVFCIKVHKIPETGRATRGIPLVNLIPLYPEENLAAFFNFKDLQSGKFLIMVTKKGLIKRVAVQEFKNIERFGQRGIKGLIIDEDDKLITVKMTDGSQDVFVGTKKGKFIRFNEKKLRPTGRIAKGCRAIRLGHDDEVVDMQIINGNSTMLSVTENGYGKRTVLDEYRIQNRGGKGCKNINITSKNGKLIGIKEVFSGQSLMIISKYGKIIWIQIDDISIVGRNTQGIKLIELEGDDKVVSIALIAEAVNETEVDIDNENDNETMD